MCLANETLCAFIMCAHHCHWHLALNAWHSIDAALPHCRCQTLVLFYSAIYLFILITYAVRDRKKKRAHTRSENEDNQMREKKTSDRTTEQEKCIRYQLFIVQRESVIVCNCMHKNQESKPNQLCLLLGPVWCQVSYIYIYSYTQIRKDFIC